MTDPEVEAAIWRLRALAADALAARYRLTAAAVETAETFRVLATAYQAGFDQELAEHPDMTELNVQLDSFYGGSTP